MVKPIEQHDFQRVVTIGKSVGLNILDFPSDSFDVSIKRFVERILDRLERRVDLSGEMVEVLAYKQTYLLGDDHAQFENQDET